MKIQFELNDNRVEVEAEKKATLLWILRDHFKLTGTKYSCGIAQCGACTVHVDGNPVRSCVMPISAIQNKKVTTIEGLGKENLHPLQKAWIAEQVPQCGYCQSGQIMQAAALLDQNPSPTREEILTHMNGVLCRCGAYMRIVKAIQSVSQK
jgi:isoquinoline 1-oxidoreductase alpha subunit